jgi:hypothetical protein
MRLIALLILLASLFLAACDEKPKNPVAVQGDRLIDSYHRSQDARDEANLDAIKKAIQAYRAANDKLPQDLEEIKPLLSAPDLDLSKFTYNPADGSAAIKK